MLKSISGGAIALSGLVSASGTAAASGYPLRDEPYEKSGFQQETEMIREFYWDCSPLGTCYDEIERQCQTVSSLAWHGYSETASGYNQHYFTLSATGTSFDNQQETQFAPYQTDYLIELLDDSTQEYDISLVSGNDRYKSSLPDKNGDGDSLPPEITIPAEFAVGQLSTVADAALSAQDLLDSWEPNSGQERGEDPHPYIKVSNVVEDNYEYPVAGHTQYFLVNVPQSAGGGGTTIASVPSSQTDSEAGDESGNSTLASTSLIETDIYGIEIRSGSLFWLGSQNDPIPYFLSGSSVSHWNIVDFYVTWIDGPDAPPDIQPVGGTISDQDSNIEVIDEEEWDSDDIDNEEWDL